jgi:hypothetical protein
MYVKLCRVQEFHYDMLHSPNLLNLEVLLKRVFKLSLAKVCLVVLC